MKKQRVLYICFGLTLLFIWGNSLMPASVSGAFSGFVKELLSHFFTVVEEAEGDGVLRKIAHGTEFALLGGELLLLGRFRDWPWSQVLLCGFGTAFLDETIQLFVPGRCGAIRDVWIDMGGFFAGLLICWGILKFRGKRNPKFPGDGQAGQSH